MRSTSGDLNAARAAIRAVVAQQQLVAIRITLEDHERTGPALRQWRQALRLEGLTATIECWGTRTYQTAAGQLDIDLSDVLIHNIARASVLPAGSKRTSAA